MRDRIKSFNIHISYFYRHHYVFNDHILTKTVRKDVYLYRFLRSSNTSGQEAGTWSRDTVQRHFSWFESFASAEKGAGLAPHTNVAWDRFRPGTLCGLSLLLVVVLLRGFFSGFSCFPSFTKTNALNSNSTRIKNPHWNQAIFIKI